MLRMEQTPKMQVHLIKSAAAFAAIPLGQTDAVAS
jgi:hypothetical protein